MHSNEEYLSLAATREKSTQQQDSAQPKTNFKEMFAVVPVGKDGGLDEGVGSEVGRCGPIWG